MIPASQGNFDFIVATGVLHHVDDPIEALRALVAKSHSKSVFRIMLYSRWGRDLLYGAKDLAKRLGLKEPKEIRKMIASLPADHPYRVYFHLYSDTKTDDGLADGYLHPCDQPFDADSLFDLLAFADLELVRFLHRPEGLPSSVDAWGPEFSRLELREKMALLDLIGDFEENFLFLATAKKLQKAVTSWEWNEALPEKGSIHSKLLGKKIKIDRSLPPNEIPEIERQELQEALFLLPGEL